MSERIDMSNMRFGKLIVLEKTESINNRATWKCKCDCGNILIVKGVDLRRNNIKSCGCYRHEFRHTDLSGQKFGKLTVAKRENLNAGHGSTWLCQCECGKQVVVRRDGLITGHTTSCGCFNKSGQPRIRHGMSNTRLHRIWNGMKQRCSNPNFKQYKDYGGRGIKVCDEWNGKYGFDAFAEWALSNGYSESLEIDRQNNELGYFPDNCRWVTHKENMNNTRRWKHE